MKHQSAYAFLLGRAPIASTTMLTQPIACRPFFVAGRGAYSARRRLACALIVIACANGLSAEAAVTPAPPAFVQAELGPCRLAGRGDFTGWGLTLYRASLWVGAAGFEAGSITQQSFALQLRYTLDLRGERIADKSAELMASMDAGTAARREQWRQRMRAVFPDVRSGDTLTGIYRADQALTRFFVDGRPLGAIAGADFARAFFDIWLSPRSPDPSLRRKLLAGTSTAP